MPSGDDRRRPSEAIASDGSSRRPGSVADDRSDAQVLPVDFVDAAARCGLLEGGSEYESDLSSNPAHLEGFGTDGSQAPWADPRAR